MNHVDYLLINPFSSLSQEEKIEIKRLGPHQPTSFALVQSKLGQQSRHFSTEWFKRVKWLTVSEEKKSLFCFYCVLFDSNNKMDNYTTSTVWSKTGFIDLKHLSERLKLT